MMETRDMMASPTHSAPISHQMDKIQVCTNFNYKQLTSFYISHIVLKLLKVSWCIFIQAFIFKCSSFCLDYLLKDQIVQHINACM
jgi:hypothetical protein